MSVKRLLPLLLLLVVSFILMTYQGKKGIIVPFRFLGNTLTDINSILHSFSMSVKEPFRKITLRDEENRKLRREIDSLLLEQQRYREVFLENQRLRDIFSLKEKEKRYITAARIISKGPDNWANTLIIDKGRQAGITKDMSVITPKGLVGKITLATDNQAYVLLLNDINFSVSVRLQETRKEGILSGTGSGCILKYISQEDVIKKGDMLVTSGLDGLFPSELPVGYIYRVSTKETGIFQDIEVRPLQDLTRLDEVIIVRR